MTDDFDLGDVLHTDIAGKEWRWNDLTNRDKMYYYELRRYWPNLSTAEIVEKIISKPQPEYVKQEPKEEERSKYQFSKGFICGAVFGILIAYVLYLIILAMRYL